MRGPATLALAAVLLLAASPARAAVLGFGCISGNLAGDCAIGEAQLAVDATDAGGGQVLFSFWNSGPAASSITDVYFDDGSLLALATVLNNLVLPPGVVDFSQDASPGNLPAANNVTPAFNTTAGFNADSNPPTQPNGVNPGDLLGILFTLQPGQDFNDVLAELGDGTLRIGIHVQGYASGGSESLVNHPLPEPTTLALVGLALGALVGARARRS